jgi:hypothetical protein
VDKRQKNKLSSISYPNPTSLPAGRQTKSKILIHNPRPFRTERSGGHNQQSTINKNETLIPFPAGWLHGNRQQRTK